MKTRVTFVPFCAAGLLLLAGAGRGAEAPPAEWSAERLRAEILRAQQAVHSLYVVYRSRPGAYDPKEYPPGTYLLRVVAAKEPHFLYHVGAHGHDRMDWRDDPLQQRCYVTADRWWVDVPVNRTYFGGKLRPADPLPGSMPGELFFLATGLWPCAGREPPRFEGRPIVLREVAASADYKVVRPRQELVDGHWCHVLEHPGLDRLWVDTRRGCALLARESYAGKYQALMQRLELGGHREAAPGVWLPGWLRNVQYDYLARTPEARAKPAGDATCDVLEARANDVDDALFRFTPPPGALDQTTEPWRQTEPGGLDHLDSLVGWVRGQFPDRRPPAPGFPWGYLAGAPALLGIVAWEVWLRRRAG
jgi:hypothetical protein